MSTPDQPESPQLTRRQLRELRNTASTPVITPEEAEAAAAAAPVVAPLPRAAEPAPIAAVPPVVADVDLGSPAMTRRAARQQERLRTASIPVIGHADVPQSAPAAEVAESAESAGEDAAAADAADATGHDVEASTEHENEVEAGAAEAPETTSEAEPEAEAEAAAELVADTEHDVEADAAPDDVPEAEPEADAEAMTATDADVEVDADAEVAADAEPQADSEPVAEDEAPAEADVELLFDSEPEAGAESEAPAVVAPTFGSQLLAGEGVEVELPASFDQLLGRSSTATGSLAASNALILSQTPETASLAGPIAATGEVLITGTYNLPESFGSAGTSHGSSDGKEIDAVLVDGELPPASSPTPIAASSAISTIKSAEDIIKPPAPEKGSRLMLALVITAGALALALTGVLIVALVTGAVG